MQKSKEEPKTDKVLAICMPTYNRPECVRKSLEHYERVIGELGVGEKVEICISDNSLTDETKKEVAKFSGKLDIKYSRNGENLGYDRNVILAMSLASARFAQLVGDELLFCKESLANAISALESGKFDVLFFDDDRLFGRKKGKAVKEVGGKDFWGRVLSYPWVLNRSMTHIDCVVIKKADFDWYLRVVGDRLGEFDWLTFVQQGFYMYALLRAQKVCVLERVNEPAASNVPKKIGVYFPTDDARVFYYKYFFEYKKCFECGVIGEREYAKFKRNFCLSAINHLLRIRTHMYPRIYKQEERETLKHIVLVEKEYGGVHWLALWAARKALFTEAVPYHLLYVVFDAFRAKVLGKPRVSAIELYEKCLDGKESEGSSFYKSDF